MMFSFFDKILLTRADGSPGACVSHKSCLGGASTPDLGSGGDRQDTGIQGAH